MKNPLEKPPRPIWQGFLIIIGTVSVIAIAGLFLFNTGAAASNVYFIAAVVLWIISVGPVFGEMGGNARLTRKAQREGLDRKELVMGQEDKYRRGWRVTFLYGMSGIICFILAFVSLGF
jgi:hypothetical protein